MYNYRIIFIFILIFSFHVLLLFLLSLIPSIKLCSVAFSSISNNFECGFYSIIISSSINSIELFISYNFCFSFLFIHFNQLLFNIHLLVLLFLLFFVYLRVLLNYYYFNIRQCDWNDYSSKPLSKVYFMLWKFFLYYICYYNDLIMFY